MVVFWIVKSAKIAIRGHGKFSDLKENDTVTSKYVRISAKGDNQNKKHSWTHPKYIFLSYILKE